MKDPVVQVGDPVLRAVAKPVPKKDIASPKITKLVAHMKKVLSKEEYGVAIAAPQVGEALRIFVVAGRAFLSPEEKDAESPPDRVFINPKLTLLSRKTAEMSEGCLSVRNKYGTVLRHEKAALEAHNEKGERFTYNGAGLIGHIFQHECDHLDGILYIDKAVTLEDDENWKKLKDKRAKGAR